MKILAIGDFHGKIPRRLRERLKKENFDIVFGLGDYAGVSEWGDYIEYRLNLRDLSKAKTPEEFFGKKKFKKILLKDYEGGKRVIKYLTSFGKPVISVFGNGDEEWYDYPFEDDGWEQDPEMAKFLSTLKNFQDVTYNVVDSETYSVVGFGGYIDALENHTLPGIQFNRKRYEAAVNRLKQSKKAFGKLLKRAKKPHKIFLFHYPPKGYFDKVNIGGLYKGISVGPHFFTESIKKHEPKLVFCGHMHEYQGKKKAGKTTVISIGAASLGRATLIDFAEKSGRIKKIKFLK